MASNDNYKTPGWAWSTNTKGDIIPINIADLGQGQIVSKEDEKKILKMLAEAEEDPVQWLVLNYSGTEFCEELQARRKAEEEARLENARILRKVMAMEDEEGRMILGIEMLATIRANLDYESLSRKTLRLRPLAQGELWKISKDERYTAWVVDYNGGTGGLPSIEARLYGRFIIPPEGRTLACLPAPSNDKILEDLEASQASTGNALMYQEDRAFIALLDAAAQTVNAVMVTARIGAQALADVQYQVERNRLVVDKFLVSREDVDEILDNLSDKHELFSERFDPCNQSELKKAGYHGKFQGAAIWSEAQGAFPVIPRGTVYAVAAPEYLGEQAIRVEHFSEPYNEKREIEEIVESIDGKFPVTRTVTEFGGWAYCHIGGMCIPNSRAVAKLSLV